MPDDAPTLAEVEDALQALDSVPDMTREQRQVQVTILRAHISRTESKAAMMQLLESVAKRPTLGQALQDPRVYSVILAILLLLGGMLGIDLGLSP